MSLNFFRKEPPTDEELLKNLAIIKLKQKNAAELDKIYKKPGDSAELEKQLKGKSSFPAYSEYEIMPGKNPNEK